ncbi:MAG: beta-propeller fold lactonase family protein [Actinobacteria bacterium]|nr:beta-propeller fold lactonase family protein [Actinomycetota bacterium]
MRIMTTERPDRSLYRLLAAAAVALLSLALVGAAAADGSRVDLRNGAVFVMTNDAAGNQVLAYDRARDGRLSLRGTYDTGGAGTSRIRLSSQGSVVLSKNGRQLLVANVGSSEISVFDVRRDSLELRSVVPSGGSTPNSITVNGNVVYVLNNGGTGLGNITGFRLGRDGSLAPIAGSTRPLSAAGSDPAQVSFTPDGDSLVVTEKATNRILTWDLGRNDLPGPGVVHDSDGVTPFGFDFTRDGTFVVTNAEEGIVGAATASSYSLEGGFRTISGSVPDFRSEVCWTVISKNDRYAYVTNFGDGTISSYAIAADGRIALLESIAATTTFGHLSIRDADRSKDGRYLYAIDITSRMVHGWGIEKDGSLTPIGAFPGLPDTVAGLAAS